MGIQMKYVQVLDRAGAFKGGTARVLDVGASNLYYAEPADVLAFLRKYGKRPDDPGLPAKAADLARRSYSTCPKTLTYISELFAETTIGYQAIDIFEAPATRIVDLNFERLPRAFRGRFDLVTNFGTAEHLFGQYNLFRAMHDALAVGGHFYLQLPTVGFTNHGYFTYHPRAFHDLAIANGYTVVDLSYTDVQGRVRLDEKCVLPGMADPGRLAATAKALAVPEVPDALLNVFWRKETAAPFRLRLETVSSLGAPTRRIARRYGIPLPKAPRIGTARWVLKTLGVGNALRAVGLR
jgi:SAM-dependent methyltransferase